MATMHTLFLCIFSFALCLLVGTGHRSVEAGEAVAGLETVLRRHIVEIARAEIGVKEATGNNDGTCVETYLRYTGLGKGYEWCAAYVCWCYGQAGQVEPRNPWSPALFPKARSYKVPAAAAGSIAPADLFGIYGQAAGRINHVGMVQGVEGNYLLTVEGNVSNKVMAKRRHLSTVYVLARWTP